MSPDFWRFWDWQPFLSNIWSEVMHTTLPSHARVDVDPPELVDNLVGLIQGVHASMSYVLADELALDELLAISAVAFKNYVYEPAYHAFEADQVETSRSYSSLGEFVCNYGPFEAISYFSGWDVKEFNAIATKDFWKLLQFEIASGRPVTTIGAGAPFDIQSDEPNSPSPVLVVGYHYEPRKQTLDIVQPGSADVRTVDVSGAKDFQQAEPAFTNWMAIARPSESPEWTSSHSRQRLRVLRWVVAHGRRNKEFSQETRENYAPGFKAFESFLGILDRIIDGELEQDDALTRYISAHVKGLVRARQAASSRLPVWSAEFVSDTGFDIDESEVVDKALGAASVAYGQVADVLASWTAEGGLEALRACYAEAFEAERRAVEALCEAVELLPGGF
jgi:hypothetical protein